MTGQAIALAAAADRADDDPRRGSARSSTRITSGCSGWRGGSPGAVEDARDLVQETFLRAARSPRLGAAGRAHEEAWLVRVLINICRDRWRQVGRHARQSRAVARIVTPHGNPESALIARRSIWQALDRLPPRRRAILCSTSSKARRFRPSPGCSALRAVTVRWHLSIGRREMVEVLEGSGN